MESAETPGYLSIGEVLSLLDEEFPDMTISKIRFLESQGLIVPERTPSGYRQFFPDDIARLKWVLRQQRDSFLPLKVIKAKLESGHPINFDESAIQPNLWAGTDEPTFGSQPFEPPARRSRSNKRSKEARPAAEDDAAPQVPHDSLEGAGTAEGMDAGSWTGAASAPEAASAEEAVQREPAIDQHHDAHEIGAEARRDAAAWLAALQEAPAPDRPAPSDHAARAAQSGASSSGGQGVAAGSAGAGTTGGGEGSAMIENVIRFGDSEVCELTGVSLEELERMIEFGLVAPLMMGGETTFDASAVAVVRAVKRFAERGIEPRHLRLFKNATDREASFYEQLVLPLLKQRNPKARAMATETLSDLVAAGEELHRALIGQLLRQHLHG